MHKPTVGVEEEFQLVDAETFELRPGIEQVLPTATAAVGEQVEPELHQSQIEVGSAVCDTLDQLREELTLLRVRVAGAAEAEGFRLVAAGTHPFVRHQDQRVTARPAYEALAERYGHLADELLVFGCHVHVAVDDPELAIQVMNRVRPWVAPLLALSTSSPYWEGTDTAYSSYRTEVFGRWPTAGAPSAFRSRAEYDALVGDLVATESIDGPARLYWEVRPSAKYPTLEFRVADVCTSVDDAVLLAGLARALVVTVAHQAVAGDPEPVLEPELLRSASWRAARHGLDADLVDLRAMRAAPARDVLHDLVAFVRPALEDNGDRELVEDHLERLLARGTSARRQREVMAGSGDLAAVVQWLAGETCACC